jgi:hypothetical protein
MPFDAVRMIAGIMSSRGSGPGQKSAFENPVARRQRRASSSVRILQTALRKRLSANTLANAQSSNFRCQRIDAIDDNPKSKHKWQHFRDDVNLQKRVFYIDAPCSDAGPAYYATGGGFEFNNAYLAMSEYAPWRVIWKPSS